MRTLLLLLALTLPAQAQQPVKPCIEGIASGSPGVVSCANILNPLGMASAVEGSRIIKAVAGTLAGFQANNTNAASRFIMLFDAATVPGDGVVTGCTTTASVRPCLMKVYQLGGSSTLGVSWAPGPFPIFTTGIILVCSSAGPFTKTATSDCTFSAEAQ